MSWSITAVSVDGFKANAETAKAYQTDKVKLVIDGIVVYAEAFAALCPEGKVPLMESSGHIDTSHGYCKTDFKYVSK